MLKNKISQLNLIFSIIFAVFLILSAVYIRGVWLSSTKNLSDQAMLISNIAATGVDGEMIKSLQAVPEDQTTVAFSSVKKRLEHYLKADSRLRFVYLYTMKNDRLYFMVDSEPINSEDYSPPGQEYVEADEIYHLPFSSKKSVISGIVTDRWGKWVSVLTPLTNTDTGQVFAVLGMDYSAENWNGQAVAAVEQAVIQIILIFLIAFFVFYALRINIKNEERFRSLLKNIPGAAYRSKVDKKFTLEFISDRIKEITGYPAQSFLGGSARSFVSVIYEKDKLSVLAEKRTAIERKENFNIEYRLKTAAGRLVWVKEKGRAIYNAHGDPIHFDGIIFDISKDRETLSEIKSKQEKLEKINKFMVGRELKMAELKKRILELENKKNENKK